MDFSKHIDEEKTVDATKFQSSASPWKQRIMEFLLENQNSTSKQILKATDPKYDGTNYTTRKHCLDSQMTYIRQDYSVVIRHEDDHYVAVGVVKGKKMTPFKSALPHVKLPEVSTPKKPESVDTIIRRANETPEAE